MFTKILVTTLIISVGFAAPAQASDYNDSVRYRALSQYDATPIKTVSYTCPSPKIVLGMGASVIDGNGGVVLTALVPSLSLASVTARATALPGMKSGWALAVFAICGSSAGWPVLVPGPATATCDEGYRIMGMGFRLPEGGMLTGLVPSDNDTSVTVQFGHAFGAATAYAICAFDGYYETYHPSVKRFGAALPDKSSPKQVTGSLPDAYTSVYAVGDRVIGQNAFIDALVPNAELTAGTLRAVKLSDPAAKSLSNDDDPWTVTLDITAAYYY